MKKIYLLLVVVLLGITSNAQVGLTASGGTPTGTFTTLKDAFDAINLGTHTGAIVISITANTTETASAALNASGSGGASYTSINLSPSGGAAVTVTGSLAAPLIDLNGADNVTIDGLNSGGNSLTISNTNTGGQAIRFILDATSNIIQNCTILGVNNTVTSGVIFFSTAAAGGNDNNTITKNTITSGATLAANIIYSLGSASPNDNSGVTISDNNIADFFLSAGIGTGVLVGAGNTAWTISGNSFYQTASRTGAATISAININSSTHNGASIAGNFIGGTSATCGVVGTPWTLTGTSVINNMNGIIVNVGTTTETSVQDNTIRNILFNTQSTGAFNAINILGGNVNVGTVTGNKIGLTTASGSANGSISFQQNSSTGGIFNGIINQSASAGIIVIKNNNVSGVTLFTSSSNTLISNFYGIRNLSTSATLTIADNLVGSTTMADNIISTQALNSTTNSAKIFGIQQEVANTKAVIITSNIVSNLTYSTGLSSAVQLMGINNGAATTSTVNISNNTISNLSNFSAVTATGFGASVIGINNSANGAAISINNNKINILKNTNPGSGTYNVLGIRSNGATFTNTCFKNVIHSLSALGSGICLQYGIVIVTGTWTFSNNMIRLGVNELGTGISGNYDIQGINASLGTNNIYHNSIYIGGSSTGTQVTYAIQSGSSNNVKNNIIVNARTNSSTSNTQIGLLFSGSGATSQDANLYFAPNAGGLLAKAGSTNYATISSLQGVAAGRDINSLNSDPKFISPTGTSSTVDLHINTSLATEVESGGLTGLGIADDIDADVRCPGGSCLGSATKPDIGADEGLFIAADLTKPVVGAFTIPAQADAMTPPTVSVTITDNNAVSVTPTSAPRIYYKRCSDLNEYNDNTSATAGWKYVETSTGTSPFSFTLDYTILNGAVTAGTFINYFVVAQDAANNVGINSPLAFATTPTNINLTTANLPATVNANYVNQITGGTVTIGTGGTFPTITGNCGCFQAVNASFATLTTDINATIISNLIEDNTYQLNGTGTSAASAVVLNIRPGSALIDTISTTIGGSSPAFTTAANMIGISGNSKVNIDGSFNGAGKYLNFRSTNATPANTYPCIKVNANTVGTTTLTVANSILEGNSSEDALGLISATASGNTIALTVTGNDFKNTTLGTAGRPNTAIYINQSGALNTNSISKNKIYNFNKYGINLFSAGISNIDSNRFYQESSFAASSSFVIYLGGGGNFTTSNITNNIIGGNTATNMGTWENSNATNYLAGVSILTLAATNKGIVSGNIIKNIKLTGTGASAFTGLNITSGTYDITNNIIGDTATTNSIIHDGTGQMAGIYYSNASLANDVNNNVISNIATKTTTNGFGFVGIYTINSNTTGNMQGNIIKNIKVAPATTAASAAYGIYIGSGVYNIGTTNANLIDSIANSGDASSSVPPYTVGIFLNSTTGACTINGNTIKKLSGTGVGSSVSVKGILNNVNAAHTITNNIIFGLSTNSISAILSTSGTTFGAGIAGIESKTNTTQIIRGNTIYDISASSASGATAAVGINFTTGSSAAGTQIIANKIYDLKNLSASGSTARIIGISMLFGGSNATNIVTIANNMISLNNNNALTNNRIYGIRDVAASGQQNRYVYNSVNIYGTAAGTATGNSHAFLRDATAATVDLKNNIFQNLRTGGTGKHYAIGNTNGTPATGWAAGVSNYNDLYATTSANIGEWGAGTSVDFTTWKSSSMGDANAVSTLATFVNPTLGDLHLNADLNCALNGAATPVAITTDFDASTRNATIPDIGADEFTAAAGTWTGTTSTDWNTATNWCGGVVPTASSNVIIPAAPSNQPNISIASPAAVVNNITIEPSATVTISTSGLLEVSGAITNNGTFNSTLGNISFVGTAAQTTPALTVNNFKVNNAAGVTLSAPLTVNGILDFTAGILTTSSANMLTLSAGSSVTGTIDNTKFVNGPITKCGITAFTFPIGKTGTLNRIGQASIDNLSTTDCFTAEYFNTPHFTVNTLAMPMVVPAASLTSPLTSSSTNEYWDISRTITTTTADVTLYWKDNVFSGINAGNYNLTDLTMTHYNTTTSKWESQISSTLGGTFADGNITAVAVSNFSPFAFGSITATTLPIAVNSFTVSKQNSNTNALNWKATCTGASVSFELQRSTNGIIFTPINMLTATQARCAAPFNYVDNYNATSPITYYKLKVISNTGEVKYSQIVAINNKNANANTIALYPNIVKGNAVLVVESKTTTNVNFVITDAKGAIVRKFTENLSEGANAYPINVSNLSVGSYQITGIIDGALKTIRFIKE